MGEDSIPLNLSAKSLADGEEANKGEHVEVEFQDSHASFYVKVGSIRLAKRRIHLGKLVLKGPMSPSAGFELAMSSRA